MAEFLISIATYKRPALLDDLLQSLEPEVVGHDVRIVVVDNDADGSARSVCEASELDIDYVVEPRPGIAAARNRGLDRVVDADRFLIFVDDDERVLPGWLTQLEDAQRRYDADVISGPVVSILPDDAPKWIARGGFIQRVRFRTGDPSLSPATNNTLVRLDYLRSLGFPRFDETFSLTGGSDTAFFRVLRDAGARMVWCDEAVVHEDVPAARANLAWIWRRGIREGNVSGRMLLRHRSRPRVVLDGVARVVYGVVATAKDLVLGRGFQARSVAYITRGVGWIGASRGRLITEYARSTESVEG